MLGSKIMFKHLLKLPTLESLNLKEVICPNLTSNQDYAIFPTELLIQRAKHDYIECKVFVIYHIIFILEFQ